MFGGALVCGFRFAHDLGVVCGPVHLLVGVADSEDSGAVLHEQATLLRAAVAAGDGPPSDGARALTLQVQGAARALVDRHGGPSRPEHLLVALLDQDNQGGVPAALASVGLAAAATRTAALTALGLPVDLPRLAMPPLIPAGTLGRPPLAVEELEPAVWSQLVWRQQRLPLHRLRSRSAWAGLRAAEERAAWRLCNRYRVDDDQRYSLLHHHRDAVAARLAAARPDLAPTPQRTPGQPSVLRVAAGRSHRHMLRFTVGWAAWFSNRRTGLRDRWFWLTTLHRYAIRPAHKRSSARR